MKKMVLILMLGVFTFGSSGFKTNSNTDISLDGETNCQEYAAGMWLIAKSKGYNNAQCTIIWSHHFDKCVLEGV